MITELMKLGLTEGEAKTYLALLQLGQTSIGRLVKESRVSHSKIYEILNRLAEKGLVNYIIKERTKYFSATHPTYMNEYLDSQEHELSEKKELLKKIYPNLLVFREKIPVSQDARVFMGLKGMRSADEELLMDANHSDVLNFFYVYDSSSVEKAAIFYYQQYQNYIKKGMRLRGIATHELKSSKYHKKPKNMEIRFIKTPLPGNINIFKNKVLIHCWRETPFCYLITSQELAEQMNIYFNQLWTIAKP
jgi:sugar-specific transcriptional regulator TrmB